jgi:hypothetical protein
VFFVAEAVKTRRILNLIPGTNLDKMLVEGLSMPAVLKEKLKPILAPKWLAGRAGGPLQNP